MHESVTCIYVFPSQNFSAMNYNRSVNSVESEGSKEDILFYIIYVILLLMFQIATYFHFLYIEAKEGPTGSFFRASLVMLQIATYFHFLHIEAKEGPL